MSICDFVTITIFNIIFMIYSFILKYFEYFDFCESKRALHMKLNLNFKGKKHTHNKNNNKAQKAIRLHFK